MNQDILSLQASPCADPDTECNEVICEVLMELAAITDKIKRLGISLPTIPTGVGQIDDGLTDAMRAVLLVVEERWPDGKPIGMRKGRWYDDIGQACLEADVTAANRTIREALSRQKLASRACQNLPLFANN